MDRELLPKVVMALRETEMPLEVQEDLLEKMEAGDVQDIEDLMDVLMEHDIPIQVVDEFVESLEEEGVSFENNPYQNNAIEELREETGYKSKNTFGEPDLFEQYKPEAPRSRYRPSPFDE